MQIETKTKTRRSNMIKNLDAIDMLLFLGIVLFTALIMVIAKFYPNDGQTFQVVSGLLTGFAGAFLARIKPNPDPSATTNGTTTGGDSGKPK